MQSNSQARHDVKNSSQSELPDLRTKTCPVDETPPAEVIKNFTSGTVTECVRLNIRKTASPDGEVVAIIDFLTEVAVDLEASTDNFYKVCTTSGVEGFCMKNYIALKR